MRRALLLAALACIAPTARAAAQSPLDRALVGYAVMDSSGRLLAAQNADRLFIPASVTKVITTAAALVMLDPELRLQTALYTAGRMRGHTLHGDLVLHGRGDPSLTRSCFTQDTLAASCDSAASTTLLRALAATLRARGVREIRGDVVGDGSWFEREQVHPFWETGDLAWSYAAPVSALSVDEGAVRLILTPGPTAGAPVRATLDPPLDLLTLTVAAATDTAGAEREVLLARAAGSRALTIGGRLDAGGAPDTSWVSLPDPALHAAARLRAELEAAGIAVRGATRATTDSLRHAAARAQPPLAGVEGRPLREWLVPVLAASNNTIAELVLKQLGRQVRGEGSWRAGLAVVRQVLRDSVGLDTSLVSLRDGSGLAVENVAAPLALVRLLRWLHAHPRWPHFAAALPLAGRSGTLATRFAATALDGRFRAKTGTLSRVSALAGVIERPAGGPLYVAVLVNNHDARSREVRAAMDALLLRWAGGDTSLPVSHP